MVTLKNSAIEGRGAFSEKGFLPGEQVHLLSGEQISLWRCLRLILTGALRADDPFQIGKRSYIILDHTSVSFNHSCNPNCGFRQNQVLFALRPIHPGEELTYDYALTVHPSLYTRFWRMDCQCGSPQCRHKIGDFSTIPQDVLREYIKQGAVPQHNLTWLAKHA